LILEARSRLQLEQIQYTVAHCNTLQHTAAHCSTLQHTATHCNTPNGDSGGVKNASTRANTMH